MKKILKKSREKLTGKKTSEPETAPKPPSVKTDPNEKIRKAAKMILAIGQENAVEVLKHLDGDSVEKVVNEMIRIGHIRQTERESLLAEFSKNIDHMGSSNFNGMKEAASFLEKTLGTERAGKHIEKVKKDLEKLDYSEIENYPPINIAHILASEMAQTTAFVLASIKPSFAAQIMARLENNYRVSVARKIATMNKVSPDIVRLTYETILEKLRKMEANTPETIEGESKLLEILNHMDASVENRLLDSLESEDPEMIGRLKEKLRKFEDITQLSSKEIKKIFDRIPNHAVWAKALKGAGQNIIRHVFSSVSMNRASDIMTEMNAIQSVSLKEIEKNRRQIMDAIDELEAQGVLVLRKDKERLVE